MNYQCLTFFQPNFSQLINYISEVALAAVAEKQALTLAD